MGNTPRKIHYFISLTWEEAHDVSSAVPNTTGQARTLQLLTCVVGKENGSRKRERLQRTPVLTTRKL
jgi:hypothetical protein